MQFTAHIGGVPNGPLVLSSEGTGIPGIKRMLYGISAHAKFNTLTRVATRSRPGMAEAVIGIVSKKPLERHAEIKNKLAQMLNSGRNDLHATLRTQMEAAFEELIGEKSELYIGKWQKAARRLIDSEDGWASFHAATFMAFCRKAGIGSEESSSRIPRTSQKLGEALDSLGARLSDETKAIGVDVDNTFFALEETKEIQGLPEGADFVKTLHMLRDRLRNSCKKLSGNLHKSVEEIRQDAFLEGAVSSTYVALEMEPTYKKVLETQSANFQQGGKAKVSKSRQMHQARVQIIRDKLASPGSDNIFECIRASMKDDFLEAVDAWLAAVEEKVSGSFKNVLEEFDNCYEIPEQHIEEDQDAAEQLLSAAKQLQRDLDGPIREALDECKRWEISSLRGPSIKPENTAATPSTEPADGGEK